MAISRDGVRESRLSVCLDARGAERGVIPGS
jgi:hypothetical protein